MLAKFKIDSFYSNYSSIWRIYEQKEKEAQITALGENINGNFKLQYSMELLRCCYEGIEYIDIESIMEKVNNHLAVYMMAPIFAV